MSSAQSRIEVAFQRLQREVAYASAISAPSTAPDPYVEFLLTNSGTDTCVELRLLSSARQLQRRSWPHNGSAVTPTAWKVLVSPVSSPAPFVVTAASVAAPSPTLQLNLAVTTGSEATATTRETRTTFAAMNGTADDTRAVCTEGRSVA